MARKLTPQQAKLKADFEKMMNSHKKPLERGAKAKGVKSTAAPKSKLGVPLVERNRVDNAKSVDTGYASTAAKKIRAYTGDKMVGISQMHKSNAVPVFNEEAVKDITKMRRG